MDRNTEPSPATIATGQPRTGTGRLRSLDAFRGLTILGMILVNNPGTWSHLYWPVEHATWEGWTPTDLVFPFFLYIVGTAMAYSLPKYRDDKRAAYTRILRRAGVLFLLGLLLNAAGQWMPLLAGDASKIDLAHLRIPGVLLRIAVVYFLASLLVLNCSAGWQVAIAVAILAGYWAALGCLPAPGDYASNLSPDGNIVRVVDIAVLGKAHMYTQATTEPTEPEGILSTFPAVVTTLIGYWAGLFIKRRPASYATCWRLLAAGAVLALLGLGWGEFLPINKKLWTSSYVLLAGGLATIGLAGSLALLDVAQFSRLARPLEIVGINAIFVYVASGLMGRWLTLATVSRSDTEVVTLQQWLYETLFTAWIPSDKLASLAFAIATVACWWLILALMARRGWTFRV